MELKSSGKFNLLKKLFKKSLFKASDLSFKEWEQMESKELAIRNRRIQASKEKVH